MPSIIKIVAHPLPLGFQADSLRPPRDGVGNEFFRGNQPDLGQPGVRGEIHFVPVQGSLKEDVVYLFLFIVLIIFKIIVLIASSAENHVAVLF